MGNGDGSWMMDAILKFSLVAGINQTPAPGAVNAKNPGQDFEPRKHHLRPLEQVIPSPSTIRTLLTNAMPFLRRRRDCFYCGKRSSQKQSGPVRQWQCESCDAINHLDEASSRSPYQYVAHPSGRLTMCLAYRMD